MTQPTNPPTRAARLASGALVDVTELAKEAGFTLPVAMTAAAWADCVRWNEEDAARMKMVQDEAGRLWDVLWTLRVAIGNGPTLIQKVSESTLIWTLMRVPTDGPRKPMRAKLKGVVGPGDSGEPVMTIQLTTEG